MGLTALAGLALAAAWLVESRSPAQAGNGEVDPPAHSEANSVSAPEEISFGQTVDLSQFLISGEITVFDFTSPYCGPCRQLAPWMDRLHAERPGVTVVKVNINRPQKRGIDWASPVARQFGLQSIPAFLVYDAEGNVMAEGAAAKRMVIDWLRQLEAPGEDS
jgi:thioredoxin-like negative regulator of GroEL